MAPRSGLKFPENTNTVSTSKHLHPCFYVETSNEIEKVHSIAKVAWKGKETTIFTLKRDRSQKMLNYRLVTFFPFTFSESKQESLALISENPWEQPLFQDWRCHVQRKLEPYEQKHAEIHSILRLWNWPNQEMYFSHSALVTQGITTQSPDYSQITNCCVGSKYFWNSIILFLT